MSLDLERKGPIFAFGNGVCLCKEPQWILEELATATNIYQKKQPKSLFMIIIPEKQPCK